MIKSRINDSSKSTVSAIKNKSYRKRLDNFRNKIQDTYKEEQNHMLSQIQDEKPF